MPTLDDQLIDINEQESLGRISSDLAIVKRDIIFNQMAGVKNRVSDIVHCGFCNNAGDTWCVCKPGGHVKPKY